MIVLHCVNKLVPNLNFTANDSIGNSAKNDTIQSSSLNKKPLNRNEVESQLNQNFRYTKLTMKALIKVFEWKFYSVGRLSKIFPCHSRSKCKSKLHHYNRIEIRLKNIFAGLKCFSIRMYINWGRKVNFNWATDCVTLSWELKEGKTVEICQEWFHFDRPRGVELSELTASMKKVLAKIEFEGFTF